MDQTEMPCTIRNHELSRGRFLSCHPEVIPGNIPEETLLNCPVHWEDHPCPVTAGASKDGVKAAQD